MDHNEDDNLIQIYINAASNAVQNYITRSTGIELHPEHPDVMPVPAAVKQATLLLIGDFYKNREPKTDDPVVGVEYGFGHLPRSVIALLYPYRTPVLR